MKQRKMEKGKEQFLTKICVLTFFYLYIDLHIKNITFKFLPIFGGANTHTENKPGKLAK